MALDQLRAEVGAQDPARSERERRLRALCDLDALPLATRRLLADTYSGVPMLGALDRDLRSVVRALRRRAVRPDAVAAVVALSTLGTALERAGADVGLSVAEVVVDVDRDLAYEQRPGHNFTIVSVERTEKVQASWLVTFRADDRDDVLVIDVRLGDLESLWKFCARCMQQANWQPLLKDTYTGDRFRTFTAQLVGQATAPALRARHGTLHGLPPKRPETADLLVACTRTLLSQHYSFWEGKAGALWEALTREAVSRGDLPLDWPPTPIALAWAFRKIGVDGFAAEGIDWRRDRTHDARRTPAYTLRLFVSKVFEGAGRDTA